jgi:hypothetical protein
MDQALAAAKPSHPKEFIRWTDCWLDLFAE